MSKKILCIDDEEILIKTLTRLLERCGYEVYTAKNGQDGCVMAEEIQFDLLISDIRMPGLNGVEVVTEIKNNLPLDHKMPPVIFITGFADASLEDAANALNPAAFMYKPFEVDKLLARIKEILEK